MVKSTMIARVADGLPLAASMDDEQLESELAGYKSQAKAIFKKLNSQSEPMCSIESGPYYLHYLLDQGICYLSICDKSFPRKLAFNYLDELAKEFNMSYGSEAQKPSLRPYAFIKFDTFIQKTKRIYEDSRTQQNLSKLNEDLRDVTQIMTKNMEDLLWRGDSLDHMDSMSHRLRHQSEKYRKDAWRLNAEFLVRKWGIPAAIILGFLLVLYLRYKFF
ncbi:SNAP receptor [Coemansia sp. RSA 1290]|nr:Longin-like domain-containing protein [Coemansia mojavensis]KAJ1744343.1 SNAP receptor [Coemansia sp. RSA 1086]KAJ1753574.1 SNAP receptor [Coemansia sp. RSA 1821]KAJ2633934.1 SNAP receptor [Coemansia sp. RSA 1290]KAJ2652272.1 SNAP receptor [Coemansia sp. RSA 1250]KAJ2675803.1 SNAP receptor [Coemansia sp. RSA 1085]